MLLRPIEIVFEQLAKQKEIKKVLPLLEKGRLTPDFLDYIVRHIAQEQKGQGIKLEKHKEYSISLLKKQFKNFGFSDSPLVYEKGQISFRGEVIDFWDDLSLYPIRLEFFDQTLERIYFFDLKNKKAIQSLDSIFIFPQVDFKTHKIQKQFVMPNFLASKIKLNFNVTFTDLNRLSQKKGQKIFIFSRFESAFRELMNKFKKSKIYFFPPIDDCLNYRGFSFKNFHFFTDLDFQKKVKIKRFTKIRDFSVGDYVVHIDHGIAKLEGIGPKKLPLSLDEQIIGIKERKEFYYHLRFKNNAFLYVPLLEKNRITKYIGLFPRLSVLGGKQWEKVKILALKEAQNLAFKLARLYLRRLKQRIKLNFSKGKKYLDLMEKSFPFKLTKSQKQSLEDIIARLKREEVLDHILTGEAASGKTEIALRISSLFLASEKQIIFLAPTTFLAYQQYLVAKQRLKKIAQIGIISRFQKQKQNQKTIKLFNQGKIQVLVGTHKILFSKLNLENLGLLIIDEEQRFGVRQKEKIRIKKPDVSVIYLSATPIPRTLHLALSGVKSIGIVSDLPFKKPQIKEKIISKRNWSMIKKAIQKELKKGGQVYFVVPLIKDLHYLRPKLEKLLSQEVALAHGRMPEKDLAKVFSDFALAKIKILLSTPIVEHGLDFQGANSMILWYGLHFGLADLYQLRGRIGRAGKKAYFYIAVSQKMPDSSYERLIDFLSLIKKPKGFYELALRDLELRGEGEMFGRHQHGIINKVGVYLFSDLIKSEIAKTLKQNQID